MCHQVNLQDVAFVLYDYFPEDCSRVRCALEAIAQREPDDESEDVDVSFAVGDSGEVCWSDAY